MLLESCDCHYAFQNHNCTRDILSLSIFFTYISCLSYLTFIFILYHIERLCFAMDSVKILKFLRLLPAQKMVLTEAEFEVLIIGYMRELANGYRSHILPTDVQKIIMNYYPRKINYIGKFGKEKVIIFRRKVMYELG